MVNCMYRYIYIDPFVLMILLGDRVIYEDPTEASRGGRGEGGSGGFRPRKEGAI
jgi:hypothetical protein